MKEMLKARVIYRRSVKSVMSEKKLLEKLHHPFLVNMNFAFQDYENLYLVADLLTGGDLRFHMGKGRKMKKFEECESKFLIACLVLGLEHMHKQKIIHRDIKPENLVIDENGYLRVTDLGIAKVLRPENWLDTSGTPGYMAPEILARKNHGVAVDYFAVGVIAFELMLCRRPYEGPSREEVREQVTAKQVQVRREDVPQGWSLEAADFINRCLLRKPERRLGFNGPDEVKGHCWFEDLNWEALSEKTLDAPYKPKQ